MSVQMNRVATIIRQHLYGPVTQLPPFDHMIALDKQVQAIRHISRQLRGQEQTTIDVIVSLPDFEPIAVRFQRFGEVATYSLLRRRAMEAMAELCAVGMLLSGVDAAYDDALISGVEKMKDDSGRPLDFDTQVFTRIRNEQERPLNIAYFFKEVPMLDPAMRWTVRSLAEGFFDMVGVFKPT